MHLLKKAEIRTTPEVLVRHEAGDDCPPASTTIPRQG